MEPTEITDTSMLKFEMRPSELSEEAHEASGQKTPVEGSASEEDHHLLSEGSEDASKSGSKDVE